MSVNLPLNKILSNLLLGEQYSHHSPSCLLRQTEHHSVFQLLRSHSSPELLHAIKTKSRIASNLNFLAPRSYRCKTASNVLHHHPLLPVCQRNQLSQTASRRSQNERSQSTEIKTPTLLDVNVFDEINVNAN